MSFRGVKRRSNLQYNFKDEIAFPRFFVYFILEAGNYDEL